MKNNDEMLIELTDEKNPDMSAFLFCAAILLKESADQRPYVTCLIIKRTFVYSTNGATCRKAHIEGEYKDGLYRVFRKDKKNIILYPSKHNDYPEGIIDLFDISDTQPIGQIDMHDGNFIGHAAITAMIKGENAYNAKFLEKADGIFDVYRKDKLIILANEIMFLAMAPLQIQDNLPGM